jgi:hypothetical protein
LRAADLLLLGFEEGGPELGHEKEIGCFWRLELPLGSGALGFRGNKEVFGYKNYQVEFILPLLLKWWRHLHHTA